jgi:hypothetical protein
MILVLAVDLFHKIPFGIRILRNAPTALWPIEQHFRKFTGISYQLLIKNGGFSMIAAWFSPLSLPSGDEPRGGGEKLSTYATPMHIMILWYGLLKLMGIFNIKVL